MKRQSFLVIAGLVGLFHVLTAQVRKEFLLEKGWKFTREDRTEFASSSFDDSGSVGRVVGLNAQTSRILQVPYAGERRRTICYVRVVLSVYPNE